MCSGQEKCRTYNNCITKVLTLNKREYQNIRTALYLTKTAYECYTTTVYYSMMYECHQNN